MKKKRWHNKLLIIGAIFILFISSLPVAIGENYNFIIDESNDNEINNHEKATSYTNCLIFITGKCNDVNGPLVWILGFYCPLFKRTFTINARGEGDEVVNVFIIGSNPFQIGTFFDYENINLLIHRANGLLFWGQKSIISKSNSLFTICRAESVVVTI